jgi:hypothetical protein
MDCTVAGEMKDASTPGLYLATAHAQCPDGIDCAVAFPKVPAGSRFDVRFAACEIASASVVLGTVSYTRFYLQTKQGGKKVPFALASIALGGQFDGESVHSALSQPVELSVAGGEKLQICAWPNQSPGDAAFIDRMDCTAAGEMKDASTPGPYVATAHAQCPDGVNCAVAFQKPAGSRFDVQFAACEIASASGAIVNETRFYLQTKEGRKKVPLALASIAGTVNEGGYQEDSEGLRHSAVSQPVDLSVSAGERLQLFAWPTSGKFIDRMDCTVAGQVVQ